MDGMLQNLRYNKASGRIKWKSGDGGCLNYKGGDNPKVEIVDCGIKRLGICAKGIKGDMECESDKYI